MNASKEKIQQWINQKFENEDELQKDSAGMVSEYFPMFRDLLFHVPNEQYIPKFVNESPKEYEKRTKMIGSINKAKGKLAGFPDLGIKYHGILFTNELKVNGGVLTDSQKRLHPIFNMDSPTIPVFLSVNVYEVYQWCMWIVKCNFVPIRSSELAELKAELAALRSASLVVL